MCFPPRRALARWRHRTKSQVGAPSRIRTCTALGLNELPPAGWAIGAIWGSLLVSNQPPPTYQAGALPTELREQRGSLIARNVKGNWGPSRDSKPALPLTGRLHRLNASGAGAEN